jgi:SnoaL-like domain
MTVLTQTEAAVLAARHVSEFNDAVEAGNFGDFLCLFTDGAVIRFENVPGASEQEYRGRDAYTRAYDEQPPDDQIDISGNAQADGAVVLVPFTWRRDGGTGTLGLTYTDGDGDDGLDGRLVSGMTVVFA